ncbi:MAG: antA/AntB antirepressor family protein [Arsenophonus sp. NEOnobi-MAG3]
MQKSLQRPMRNYYISIDMAKELSMLEHNEKGK